MTNDALVGRFVASAAGGRKNGTRELGWAAFGSCAGISNTSSSSEPSRTTTPAFGGPLIATEGRGFHHPCVCWVYGPVVLVGGGCLLFDK